jgi:NADH:ubiquinone oxidoreductase subunit K
METAPVLWESSLVGLFLASVVIPVGLYGVMLRRRALSKPVVLAFGVVLIAIAGINIFLLQRLGAIARTSASLVDDRFFASELSVALYLLPALFAGIGVNVISHVMVTHLAQAEARFARTRQG